MNILLVQAYLGGSEPPVFPLGLSCIVSTVKGHNIKLFDPNISKKPHYELTNIMKEFKPDVVGISLRDIDSTNTRKVVFYYTYFEEMMELLKNNSSEDCKIIVGGSGFSMFAREIMDRNLRIDFGVYLEGENTFPELIENLEEPHKVRGVFYQQHGKIIFTGLREHSDLNNLPPPYRNITGIGQYKDIPDAIGIETKRGCALSCVYCPYGFLNGKEYRLRSPDKIVDEIESLVTNLGIRDFMFVDSVFNIPISHAEAVCREIIKREVVVSWSAWFNDKYMTKEFAQLVKHAGCKKIMLSPDGFSDKALLALGKNMTKEDIRNTYDILKKEDNIEFCYNFFKNPPGQSFITFIRLVFFYLKAKLELRNKVHFEFNSIRIEPHTKLFQTALREGLISEEENLLYPQFYSKPHTRYIEKFFNLMLRLKGK